MKRETYIANENKRDALAEKAFEIVRNEHNFSTWSDMEVIDINTQGVEVRVETSSCGCCSPEIDTHTVRWESLGL